MRLWPFTLTHATYLWNILPNAEHGLSPVEIFTGIKMDPKALHSEKVGDVQFMCYIPNYRMERNFLNGILELDKANT